MGTIIRCTLLTLALVNVLCVYAQPRPQVATKSAKPSEAKKLAAGTAKVNPKDGLKYAWIAAGTFLMGCSPGDNGCGIDEKPAHSVTISKGFWIGQTEVTVGAYKRFASRTGKQMPPVPSFNKGWGNEAMPMIYVSWNDAQAYCKWAGGRLPTEAEWEYAARGGSKAALYGPIDAVAWTGKNSNHVSHPVGQKTPNGFGLFDTLGNLWEWVDDWYDQDYYKTSPAQDPPGPKSGEYRVLRGGAWDFDPKAIRSSLRARLGPGDGGTNVGVRCAVEVIKP